MPDLYDRAWEILAQHVGHKNPITSAELSRTLQVGDDKRGTRETRSIVLEVIRRGLPVGATDEGYFVLENEVEKEDYIRELNDRIAGISNRGNLVIRAFATYRAREPPPTLVHWVPEPEEIA